VISAGSVLTVPEVLHRFYVYDGLDVVAEYEELDGVLNSTTYYYRGNGRLVALEREAISTMVALLWYHYDGLGNVMVLSGENGNSSTVYVYDEYGQVLASNMSWNRYTYTGQEWDKETAFYHFYARQYDPHASVWIVSDSYRGEYNDPMTQQRYQFVHNNPVNYADALGYKVKHTEYESKLQKHHLEQDRDGDYILYTTQWLGVEKTIENIKNKEDVRGEYQNIFGDTCTGPCYNDNLDSYFHYIPTDEYRYDVKMEDKSWSFIIFKDNKTEVSIVRQRKFELWKLTLREYWRKCPGLLGIPTKFFGIALEENVKVMDIWETTESWSEKIAGEAEFSVDVIKGMIEEKGIEAVIETIF
jgi:RHS repeat-associated protein